MIQHATTKVIIVDGTYELFKNLQSTLSSNQSLEFFCVTQQEFKNNSLHSIYNAEKEIADYLLQLGTPSHTKGYHYLISAISLSLTNPDVLSSVTKMLYPAIARQYGTLPNNVDRSIRHTIALLFEQGNKNLLYELFWSSLNSNREKPTNTEFISRISEKIRLHH